MIIYNNGANGTLKPPILNGITRINNTDLTDDFTLDSVTSINILSDGPMSLYSNLGLNAQCVQDLQFLSDENINFQSGQNIVFNSADTLVLQSVNTIINSSFPIAINQPIIINGFTTTEILAFSPAVVGSMVFCITINQMVFYQVSPITGTVLGWYNSTGTIKL